MKKSAGILLYRLKNEAPEVFLVHPGGPYWKNKDTGAWSIPKGEFEEEDPLTAAIREFGEEVGIHVEGTYKPLTPVIQKNRKQVFAWALKKDIEIPEIKSNTFKIQWPSGSGKFRQFPEIDKGAWFSIPEANQKIIKEQVPLIEELLSVL